MYRVFLILLLITCACDSKPESSKFIEPIRKKVISSSPCGYGETGVLGFSPKGISIVKIGNLQEAESKYNFSNFWPVRTEVKGLCFELVYDINTVFDNSNSSETPDALTKTNFSATLEFKLAKNDFNEWVAYQY